MIHQCSLPYFNMVRLEDGYAKLLMNSDNNIGRRQDCPPLYDLDTTVWIYSRDAIMDIKDRIPPRTLLYEVPEERAYHIDSELDLEIVEFLMKCQQDKVNAGR